MQGGTACANWKSLPAFLFSLIFFAQPLKRVHSYPSTPLLTDKYTPLNNLFTLFECSKLNYMLHRRNNGGYFFLANSINKTKSCQRNWVFPQTLIFFSLYICNLQSLKWLTPSGCKTKGFENLSLWQGLNCFVRGFWILSSSLV